MSGSREAILERLRVAQRTALIPDVPTASAEEARPVPSRGPDEVLGRFRQELTALGVENHVETSDASVQARVRALIGGRRVLSWDPAQLPYGLGEVLSSPATGKSPRDDQAQAEIGLTGADAGIAETGSLVMLAGPGRPRAASLLPPVHVAVVRRSDVMFGMGELFQTHEARMAAAAACTFITGPSRTADIELTLTLGVHGPGQVVVVIGP